jgi:hypothetical protein
MLIPTLAHAIMTRWFDAWNAGPNGDIDAIMACYDEAIEHSSPFIARFNLAQGISEGSDGTLRGKPAVHSYFLRALTTNPTPKDPATNQYTRFKPLHITTGISSILVLYQRFSGEIAGEVFFISEQGLITRSVSHYG